MLNVIAFAAVGLGVAIAAGIAKFSCDELSELELEKQRELTYRKDEKRLDMERKKEALDQKLAEKLEEIASRYGAQEDEERARLELEVREEYAQGMERLEGLKQAGREELVNCYLEAATARVQHVIALQGDIRTALALTRSQRGDCKTVARKNALEYFYRELQQTNSKSVGYLSYLNQYKKFIDRFCRNPEKEIEPFQFILPVEYPYKGKTLTISRDKLLRKRIEISCSYPIKIDYEEELPDQEECSAFCEGQRSGINSYGNSYRYNLLSFRKGRFRNVALVNPHIGISATVERYDNKDTYWLTAYGIPLKLWFGNLENAGRRPPVGAELRVFPVSWDTSLKWVEVSENASDALHSFSFDRLPVVFSRERAEEFNQLLTRENLRDSTDEWKIAPHPESALPDIDEVRFQLGTSVVFLASLDYEGDRSCFRYQRVLEYESYSVQPDSIFAVVDCVLQLVLEDEQEQLPPQTYQNMCDLSLFLFGEFKNQYFVKISQAGMLYYNKWSEMMDKLITYKYKGDSLPVVVDRVDVPEKNNVWVTFRDPDRLGNFFDRTVETAFDRRRVSYFVEPEPDRYLFLKRFEPTGTYRVLFHGGAALDFFAPGRATTLYCKRSAYVESRQKQALSAFRMGELANHQLQSYGLDGKLIARESTSFTVSDFHNSHLLEDASQKQAVEQSLDEKNLFLIQGPPGTGKTTVILEMIRQIIDGVSARILVVSQANVAVDNVLKRLVKDYRNQVIRCGTPDKIAPEVAGVRYEECYSDYLASLEEKQRRGQGDPELLRRWMKIVAPEEGLNPDIGELILRSRKVVGATCIGLAKKGLGLERMEFDLVIIDEAGKALPGEILVPYNRAKKVVLVGDHKQLPPVIDPALLDDEKIELEAREQYAEPLFNESFFYRLWEAAEQSGCSEEKKNRVTLTTQYRMPAVIGELISQVFYGGAIENGSGTWEKPSRIPELGGNLTMLDLSQDKAYRELTKGGVTNRREAELLQRLLLWLERTVPDFPVLQIAVISPYRAQKRLLKQAVGVLAGDFSRVAVDTVDAFQGDEADIVIYCTTRSIKPTKFFSDYRRVNVALSRARHNLIILGSLVYFKRYVKGTSPLPDVACYIEEFGEVLSPEFLGEEVIRITGRTVDFISPHSIQVDDGDGAIREIDGAFERALQDMRQQYETTGSLKPIAVRRSGDVYWLVDGYKTLCLARRLELQEVEVVLEEKSPMHT